MEERSREDEPVRKTMRRNACTSELAQLINDQWERCTSTADNRKLLLRTLVFNFWEWQGCRVRDYEVSVPVFASQRKGWMYSFQRSGSAKLFSLLCPRLNKIQRALRICITWHLVQLQRNTGTC